MQAGYPNKCTLPRICSLHMYSSSQWGSSLCTTLTHGCSTICSRSTEEPKGAIRHPSRKFPWGQQHKISEISTHEKISQPDRRVQVCLGGETCCVWVCQGSQLIAPPVLAVPGPDFLIMSRAMAAHALCGWAGWQLHWHTPFFTTGLLGALHSYPTHLPAL